MSRPQRLQSQRSRSRSRSRYSVTRMQFGRPVCCDDGFSGLRASLGIVWLPSVDLGITEPVDLQGPTLRNEVRTVGAFEHGAAFQAIAGLQRIPVVERRLSG